MITFKQLWSGAERCSPTLCSGYTVVTPRVILSRFVPIKMLLLRRCDYQVAAWTDWRMATNSLFPPSLSPLEKDIGRQPPPLSWERDLGEDWGERGRESERGTEEEEEEERESEREREREREIGGEISLVVIQQCTACWRWYSLLHHKTCFFIKLKEHYVRFWD